MRRSLFSPLWYRVSGQHPRLHLDVRVERSHARGQTWMVLIDGVSGRQFRVNDDAWQFVGRCDGSRTVEEVWDSLLETMGDAAPTQDEVIAILGRLGEQGLIVTEAVADAGILVERGERRTRVRRRGFVNPFAFRVSFGDPTAILNRLEGPGAALFRRQAKIRARLGGSLHFFENAEAQRRRDRREGFRQPNLCVLCASASLR